MDKLLYMWLWCSAYVIEFCSPVCASCPVLWAKKRSCGVVETPATHSLLLSLGTCMMIHKHCFAFRPFSSFSSFFSASRICLPWFHSVPFARFKQLSWAPILSSLLFFVHRHPHNGQCMNQCLNVVEIIGLQTHSPLHHYQEKNSILHFVVGNV